MNRGTLSTLLVLVMVGVFASVAVLAIRLRQISGVDAIARCAQPLEIVADDGALLPAVLYRCERRPGRAAAVVVWPREPGAAAGWAGGLAFWGRDGRALLAMTAPRRPGHERGDLAAAAEALMDEPGIDGGRIGVVVEGAMASALLDGQGRGAAPPAGVSAAVCADPPKEIAGTLATTRREEIALFVRRGGPAPPGAVALPRRWLRLGRPSLDGVAARADEVLRGALDVAAPAEGSAR